MEGMTVIDNVCSYMQPPILVLMTRFLSRGFMATEFFERHILSAKEI